MEIHFDFVAFLISRDPSACTSVEHVYNVLGKDVRALVLLTFVDNVKGRRYLKRPQRYWKRRRPLRHLEEAFGHIGHYLYASPPSMIEDCDAWRFVAPWKDEPVPRKQRRQSISVYHGRRPAVEPEDKTFPNRTFEYCYLCVCTISPS